MENVTIKKISDSEIELTVLLPTKEFSSYINKSIHEFQKEVKIDGFRQGKVPEKIVREKVGDGKIMQRAAEISIKEVYPKVLETKKIKAIGRPEIAVTKLAEGNPLEFKAKTATLPELNLPDYIKIARSVASTRELVEVTEKEIDSVIETAKDKVTGAPTKDGKKTEKKDILVDDNFAKNLGNFKGLQDLREKISDQLSKDKKRQLKEKRRMEILEKIAEKVNVTIPEILINAELDKMFTDMKWNIQNAGVDLPHYLNHINKTEEDLKKEWSETARKRVKTNLILNEIILEEKLIPEKEAVEKEISHILANVPNATENGARTYAEQMLTYEKAYQLLEGKINNNL